MGEDKVDDGSYLFPYRRMPVNNRISHEFNYETSRATQNE